MLHLKKNSEYVDTPEPFAGRSKLSAVSFKDVEPKGQATATATLTVSSGEAKEASNNHWKQIESILKWQNPAASALVFLLGSFTALAGEFALRGDHNVTPLKGLQISPILHDQCVINSFMRPNVICSGSNYVAALVKLEWIYRVWCSKPALHFLAYRWQEPLH